MPPSRLLAGKYKLGRLIGEGGMGAVYEAEHTGLGAVVAVKLLREGAVVDDKALARFRREARAMGAIRHDNVVSVMDTGADDDGNPFLVMELLQGESLSALLRREKCLSVQHAVSVANEILAGLAAAHARGIVHRDLKPGNIFIAAQQEGGHRVKILDFGVSKLADSTRTLNVTADGVLVGTPNFMAPEAVEGRPDVDVRADVYAVGVLLYRMVAGRLPFAASSSDELYRRILAGNAIPPSQFAHVPGQLEQVIARAMHVDRDKRFATAIDFRNALREAFPDLHTDSVLPAPFISQTTPAVGSSASASSPAPVDGSAPPDRPTRPARRSSMGGRPSGISRESQHRIPKTVAMVVLLAVIGAVAALLLDSDRRRRGSDSTDGTVATDSAKAVAVDGDPPFVIGVVQYLPVAEVEAAYTPLARYLEAGLERPVALRIAAYPDELIDMVVKGEVQLAALSPVSYARATALDVNINLLATPRARGNARTYDGLILARRDSGIESLQDLKGKVFCFVDPGSSSGYLYPRMVLREEGIDPDEDFRRVVIGGEHKRTLMLLADGKCDAAAVYAGMYNKADEHGFAADSFRVLSGTQSIRQDAYCAPSSADPATVTAIRELLLALEPESQLAADFLATSEESPFIGFDPVEDRAYEQVRTLLRQEEEASKRRENGGP